MCVYVRFEPLLNMIGRKFAVLSLNTVQTWVPRSQPKIWRKTLKIGGVRTLRTLAFGMYARRTKSRKPSLFRWNHVLNI